MASVVLRRFVHEATKSHVPNTWLFVFTLVKCAKSSVVIKPIVKQGYLHARCRGVQCC